jgi:hypothetical protein
MTPSTPKGAASSWPARRSGAPLPSAPTPHSPASTPSLNQRETLSDPDNYAMAATGRLLLSNATTLRAYIQADDLTQVPASFRGWGPNGWPTKSVRRQRRRRQEVGQGEAGAEAVAAVAELGEAASGTSSSSRPGGGGGSGGRARGMSAALQLKQQLVDGYELTADLAVNEPSLDGVRRAVNTPLRLSVDVGPRPTQRLGPLLYRVGAHGVLAPATVDSDGAAVERRGSHVLAAHMQGALALAGNCTLWQAGQKPWQGRSKLWQSGSAFRPRPSAPLPPVTSSDRLPPLQVGEAGGRQGGVGRGSKSVASDAADDDAGGPQRRHPAKPRRSQTGGDSRDGGTLPLVTPGQVQDGLQETTWRLERLRTDLQSWASRARAGELLKGRGGKRRGGGGRPGGCWSSVLPPPHLRVGGLVGILGRVPLHHARFDTAPEASASRVATRRHRRAGATATADGTPLLDGDDGGGAMVHSGGPSSAPAAWLRNLGGAGRGFMEHVVFGGLSGLGGFGSHLAHDVGVRPFASGGACLQLGSMRRSFLDFSRLEATVDLGLTGPKVSTSGATEVVRGARHPAFALDGAGAWHALTLSATQQLLGPVRLRADWRLALDSAEPLPSLRRGGSGAGGAGSTLGVPQAAAAQLARHIAGMRPSLLDAAYGLDMVVPGSGGLLRGILWYSPRRAEGGIELRLL